MAEIILITGGLGYIGGRLSRYLLEQTDNHLIISTRHFPDNREEWLKSKRVKIIELDLLNQTELREACREVGCIIHLAALNDHQCFNRPWQEALIVNGLGSLNLLQAAIEMKVSRLIYISTAHVYGAPLIGTLTETTLPKPVTSYAISHKIAEDYILAAHARMDLTGIVLRLSNSFGFPVTAQNDCWNFVVNNLCKQAITTKSLQLRSTGLPQRNFISLNDVCRGIVNFITISSGKCQDGLFNLGSSHSARIIDMAELVADRCEKLYKFRPEIKTGESGSSEKADLLIYQTAKLLATGFIPAEDAAAEIDATLKYCEKMFGTFNH